MGLAASLLLAVGAGLWLRQGGFDTLRSDYVAPTGETRSVDLADGSRIDLNSGAAVAVDLQPGGRNVRLFRGEAFFTVAHDGRPFVVQTAAGEVHVVGTAFNVSLANGQARVSVLQGVVELRSADGRTTRLVHDQSASLGSAGISSVAGFDAAQVTAWQRHQMVFYRTPLGAVIDELNRYRPGHIVILGDDIRARRVTGIFDTRQPSAALDVIARTLDIRTTRVADMLILLH
jgi:transmembrane sensor